MNTELNTHNTRLIEVDVAKAFAIIYMVVDHVYERMSVVDRIATLPDSALRNIIVIQWLLIIYGFLFMMIIGSELISLEAVIPVGLIITAASIGLSVLWNKMERAAVGTS